MLKCPQLFEAKQVTMRAFMFANKAVPDKNPGAFNDDFITRNEFRIFLVALRQRFEYWIAF